MTIKLDGKRVAAEVKANLFGTLQIGRAHV